MRRTIQTSLSNQEMEQRFHKHIHSLSEYEQEKKSGYFYGTYAQDAMTIFLEHELLKHPRELTFEASIEDGNDGVNVSFESVKDTIKLRNKKRFISLAILTVGLVSLPISIAYHLWMISLLFVGVGFYLFLKTFSNQMRVHQVIEEKIEKMINDPMEETPQLANSES